MGTVFSTVFLLLFLLISRCWSDSERGSEEDAKALLAIKTFVDAGNVIPWRKEEAGNACNWRFVKECAADGRIRKLVVEYVNLTGALPDGSLAPLDQLRVLSFKSNSLSGSIPDLSPLINLKILYLNDNYFSGAVPDYLPTLHRLKIVVLSGNLLAGVIPPSIARIPRLYTFYVEDNRLTGSIPALRQAGLRYLNVSNNNLSGAIPQTEALARFNSSSFLNNRGLCGQQIEVSCTILSTAPVSSPFSSPLSSDLDANFSSSSSSSSPSGNQNKRLAAVVGGSVGAFLFLAVCLVLVASRYLGSQTKRAPKSGQPRSATMEGGGDRSKAETPGASGREVGDGGPSGSLGSSGKRGFSWEAEGLGKLVFCGGVGEMYSLEDLLKASAETLGRGTVGSTYKAVMESGFIVTVKRLRDSGHPGLDEFRRRMEVLGRLRHPNIVPVRAYFQAKEERLLVYDYFPNGSLFSLIHGSRPSGVGKPLHWTSCLKIAEDVATGLLYLHQTPGMVHGNLKSSNVLLGSDFESCLTDYGLVPCFRSPEYTEDSNATAMFYRAPEARRPNWSFTQQADVYSFGVLVLELLTGKTPFQDLVERHGANIPQWVRSVREDETDSADDPLSGNEASEDKLGALLDVAMACVSTAPESRPPTKDVLKMIKEARADVVVSSAGSDHSPARWSDAVQSLPRDYGSEHSNFAERD